MDRRRVFELSQDCRVQKEWGCAESDVSAEIPSQLGLLREEKKPIPYILTPFLPITTKTKIKFCKRNLRFLFKITKNHFLTEMNQIFNPS